MSGLQAIAGAVVGPAMQCGKRSRLELQADILFVAAAGK